MEIKYNRNKNKKFYIIDGVISVILVGFAIALGISEGFLVFLSMMVLNLISMSLLFGTALMPVFSSKRSNLSVDGEGITVFKKRFTYDEIYAVFNRPSNEGTLLYVATEKDGKRKTYKISYLAEPEKVMDYIFGRIGNGTVNADLIREECPSLSTKSAISSVVMIVAYILIIVFIILTVVSVWNLEDGQPVPKKTILFAADALVAAVLSCVAVKVTNETTVKLDSYYIILRKEAVLKRPERNFIKVFTDRLYFVKLVVYDSPDGFFGEFSIVSPAGEQGDVLKLDYKPTLEEFYSENEFNVDGDDKNLIDVTDNVR